MKKHLTLTLFVLTATCVFAQVADKAAKAFETASAKDLSVLFAANLELQLDGTEGTFTREEAKQKVGDFFTKNPVASFSISHKGGSGSGKNYAIGIYTSSNGSKFRVTIYYSDAINELKIEKS